MAKSLNGQPIQMNVEVLVVTDSSALQSHQIYAGTTDQNKIFAHMRLYYAHLFNGVFYYPLFYFYSRVSGFCFQFCVFIYYQGKFNVC